MAKKGQYKANASARSKYQRKYNSSPEQKKNRAARNKARRNALRQGKVHKGDGKDIDHKDGNPTNNSKKNVRVMSRKKNRSRNNNK